MPPWQCAERPVTDNEALLQMVFIIDLPKFDDPHRRASSKLTAFGEDLSYFLTAQGMDEKLVNSLGNYDFSETSRYGFVHTMYDGAKLSWLLPLRVWLTRDFNSGGSHHADDSWTRTGEFLGPADVAM